MYTLPPPERRLFLMLILAVAALLPFYTSGWGLEGRASAHFDSNRAPQGSTLISAQFSLSFGA